MTSLSLSDIPASSKRKASGNLPWTEARRAELRRLWLENHTSGEIAQRLGGTTRNAVMGMVDRLGLMGRGGQRIATTAKHPIYAQITSFVAELFNEPCSPTNTGHAEALVILAAVAIGRRTAPAIAKATNLPFAQVEAIQARLDATGIWPKTAPLPERWNDGTAGNVALLYDCFVAAGAIAEQNQTPLAA